MKQFVLAFSLALGFATAALAQETVSLVKPRDLREEIEAMPQIVAPKTPATMKINRALKARDREVLARQRACTKQARELGRPSAAGIGRWSWVKMRGPEFLTIESGNSSLCATPYEARWLDSMTYDLRTGDVVDWTQLMPGLTVVSYEEYRAPPQVKGRALHARFMKAYRLLRDEDPECIEAIDRPDEAEFVLVPDPKDGGLRVQPSFLPHVIQACEDSVTLDAADMRTLGVAPRLVDAIQAARKAGAFDAEAP